jgi:hypothetical protein
VAQEQGQHPDYDIRPSMDSDLVWGVLIVHYLDNDVVDFESRVTIAQARQQAAILSRQFANVRPTRRRRAVALIADLLTAAEEAERRAAAGPEEPTEEVSE